MFLHLSVILFTGGVGFLACITGHITRGVCIRGVCLHGGLPPGRVCIEGGLHPGGVGQTPPPPWDTMGYGQQAGGTHPTGICILVKKMFRLLFSFFDK